VIAPAFETVVVPLSIVILIGLFAVQSRGTAKVGAFFGPIILIWFAVLAAIGMVHIAEHPGVLAAFNPIYGLTFLLHNGLIGFTVLGLVFLAVTGAETLYADLGAGRWSKPLGLVWHYQHHHQLLGQGALVLATTGNCKSLLQMFPPGRCGPSSY
jgi:KUP system potassium uptake protein